MVVRVGGSPADPSPSRSLSYNLYSANIKLYAYAVSLVFSVIGDLVASRQASSRTAVQAALQAALSDTSTVLPPIDRLEPTVGNEFQGAYASFSAATLATLMIRLRLDGIIDIRCGLGAGDRETLGPDRTPLLQDGPAWWSAREAIEALGAPANRLRRTWYDGRYAGGFGPPEEWANAYLTVRDALVDRLSARARSMLLLALEGRSQREIAKTIAVSQSAVSQSFARGVGAVRDAQRMLARLDPESSIDPTSAS